MAGCAIFRRMDTRTETLGQRLTRLRGTHRVEEVAGATGLSFRTIKNLEADRYEARLESLRAIAAFHGISLGALVDGVERAS